MGNDNPVELATIGAVNKRGALDEIVAREREKAPFGRASNRVAGASDALEKARDRVGRANLADEINVANVDAELEGSRRDQRLQRAAFQASFGIEPLLLAETAMVCGHVVLPYAIGNLARNTLGHASGIDEDERRAMGSDERGQPIVDFGPHLV